MHCSNCGGSFLPELEVCPHCKGKPISIPKKPVAKAVIKEKEPKRK